MTDVELENSNEAPEPMVREYLSAALDGQVGRAERRFHAFLREQSEGARPAKNDRVYRFPPGFRGWTVGVIGAAMAASLAALMANPSLQRAEPQGPGLVNSSAAGHGGTSFVRSPILIQQDVRSQMFDDGTYMADDSTPVRVLRRRDAERTRWFDQDGRLQGEQVVPSDHTVYVQLKTY